MNKITKKIKNMAEVRVQWLFKIKILMKLVGNMYFIKV